MICLWFSISLVVCLLSATSAAARPLNDSYSPVACPTWSATSSAVGFPASNIGAWDGNVWKANVAGAGQTITCDFGSGNSYPVVKILLVQSTTANSQTSKVYVTGSVNCSAYVDLGTFTVAANQYAEVISLAGLSFRCISITTQSAHTGAWEVEFVRFTRLDATPTSAPTNTPIATPDYFVEVTSTQGAPMRLERSGDFGQLAIFGMLAFIAVVIVLLAMLIYWRGRTVE